ncbi:hypothetical protein AFCA_011015 [Aspergillus flavus]|uniref:Jacalin-type lectin domain-containing protein n=1 Tax=Aspergillus flavus TaxID=5059 RepID=A0AB74CEX1_ASPFL|nr:hypothetical protein CA14_011088 [Aspergillus flavus]UDD63754.1 hypothetical protein AFCA_011015 [Aspergillus flavus]
MSPIIQNPPTGGKGGTDFGNSLWKFKPVRQLEVWWGQGSGDQHQYTVLKGLRLHWDGESPASTGTVPQDDSDDLLHSSYTFADHEKIHWMNIHGAPSESSGRADSLRFLANNNFAAGGSGGGKRQQSIGNGTLFGLQGKSGSDIDSLRAVFQP